MRKLCTRPMRPARVKRSSTRAPRPSRRAPRNACRLTVDAAAPHGPLDRLRRAARGPSSAARSACRAGSPWRSAVRLHRAPADGAHRLRDQAGQRRERHDLGVAVLVDAVADDLARAGPDRRRWRRCSPAGAASRRRRGRGSSRRRPSSPGRRRRRATSAAPGRIAGLASLQSAGRRTPSPSASPSISSHEMRGVGVVGDRGVVAGRRSRPARLGRRGRRCCRRRSRR